MDEAFSNIVITNRKTFEACIASYSSEDICLYFSKVITFASIWLDKEIPNIVFTNRKAFGTCSYHSTLRTCVYLWMNCVCLQEDLLKKSKVDYIIKWFFPDDKNTFLGDKQKVVYACFNVTFDVNRQYKNIGVFIFIHWSWTKIKLLGNRHMITKTHLGKKWSILA